MSNPMNGSDLDAIESRAAFMAAVLRPVCGVIPNASEMHDLNIVNGAVCRAVRRLRSEGGSVNDR